MNSHDQEQPNTSERNFRRLYRAIIIICAVGAVICLILERSF